MRIVIYKFFPFGIMAYIIVNLFACGSVHSFRKSVPLDVKPDVWSLQKEFNLFLFNRDGNGYSHHIYGNNIKFSVYISNTSYRKTHNYFFGIPAGTSTGEPYFLCHNNSFSIDIYVEENPDKTKIKTNKIQLLTKNSNIYSKGICNPSSAVIESCCSCLNNACKAVECYELITDDTVLEESNCYSIKFDIQNISPTEMFTLVLPMILDTGCDQGSPCESTLRIDFAPNH